MQYNVVIVGASISGLYSGYKLAKAGLSVFIVDRRSSIGTPVRCGEATGNRAELERFLPYDESYIAQKLTGLAVHLNGEEKVSSEIDETGVILRRDKFELFMADLAQKEGATLRLETSVIDVLKGEKGLYQGITLATGECITADYIIGADGAESFVGQKVGLTKFLQPKDAFTSVQYRIDSHHWNDGKMHFFVGQETIPNGYIWVFPKSETEVSVGAGLFGSHREGKRAKEFLLSFIDEFFPDDKRHHLISGCAPLSISPKKLVKGNVLIVGDAARMVNPLTAGGIMNALEAADLMGNSIIKAISSGSRKPLRAYERKWNFKPRMTQKMFYIMKEIFLESSDERVDKSLHVAYRFLSKADRSKAFSIPLGSLFEMVKLYSGSFLKRIPLLWRE